ncbi:MAG: SMI1/KNR4 family protein [Bacteroidota bacterium]
MNTTLMQAVESFLAAAQSNGMEGVKLAESDFAAIPQTLGEAIPPWYKELMKQHPLSGMELMIPHSNPEFEGAFHVIELASIEEMESESVECYPGLAILPKGYVCIGIDPEGSGDPYFISNQEGDNPPVYQVLHDVSAQGDEIIAGGLIRLADSMSDLFIAAKENL